MKKALIFSSLIVIALAAIAGGVKVKIKKDIVYVDDTEYAKWVKEKGMVITYEVRNLSDSTLLKGVLRSYNDPSKISSSNKTGMVSYIEFQHMDTGDIYFEYQGTAKRLFKTFHEQEIITPEGHLNRAKLDELANAIGTEHSRKRENMN